MVVGLAKWQSLGCEAVFIELARQQPGGLLTTRVTSRCVLQKSGHVCPDFRHIEVVERESTKRQSSRVHVVWT